MRWRTRVTSSFSRVSCIAEAYHRTITIPMKIAKVEISANIININGKIIASLLRGWNRRMSTVVKQLVGYQFLLRCDTILQIAN